jgi:hypothetical protein
VRQQSAVASDIGGEYSGEFAFDRLNGRARFLPIAV